MKSIFFILSLVAAILTASTAALAWDGPSMWYDSPAGGPGGPDGPGGGGLVATGGAIDHNITCANCHVKDTQPAYGTIGADVTFNPPIATTYKGGQSYQVTIALTGEHEGLSGCMSSDPGNVNGFAASFEYDSGKVAGKLAAAYGNAASCTPTLPSPMNATTYTYGDCHAVMGRNQTGGGPPTWTFTWVAPTDGANVTMYYGVVDGNCMMDSMGDDAKVGTKKLGTGTALRSVPANGDRMLACLGVFPVFAMVGMFRKRARRSPR